MEKKEDFYHELDKKGRRSFCTCHTLAIGFLVLAVALGIGLAVVVKKIATVISPARQVTASRDDVVALQDKVAALSKAPGASTSLTLTETELTSLLIEAINKDKDIPLRGVQVAINPDSIVLTGTATKYLTTTLTIELIPKVVEGRPKLELTKIQAGTFAVPSVLTQLIASKVSDLLEKEIGQVEGMTIKSILLDQGRMTISGLNPS
jgi:hypothetical protein